MARKYENKDKSIMCPNCNKLLTMADSKDPREHRLTCRRCGKWIWYVAKADVAVAHETPIRQSASGKRFY